MIPFFTSSGGCKYTAAPTKRKDGIKKESPKSLAAHLWERLLFVEFNQNKADPIFIPQQVL
jgi:hypothetical protein